MKLHDNDEQKETEDEDVRNGVKSPAVQRPKVKKSSSVSNVVSVSDEMIVFNVIFGCTQEIDRMCVCTVTRPSA